MTLREFLRSGKLPPGAPHKKALLEPVPVAVRLHLPGSVRLAYNKLTVDEPLYRAVEHLVVAAASGTPRGPLLAPTDLDALKVEIVVLREATSLSAPEQCTPGHHGVIVRLGDAQAMTLPRDVEAGWSAERVLDETCRRAGLLEPEHAWRGPDAEIIVFVPDCFGDFYGA